MPTSHWGASVFPSSHDLAIACTPRLKRTGRPQDTSLKSWKKHDKLEKDTRRKEESSNTDEGTTDVGKKPSKTRRLDDILHVA